MYYVSEQVITELVGQDAVTAAVADAFVALADCQAECWPIVREVLGHADAIFGFKSGFDRRLPAMGVKAGGLWPGNAARGVPNHQSTVVLFDEVSGAPKALIRATYLTALRTAAASALSIRHLARSDARVLGIIGAGGQSEHQIRAALKERSFDQILISDPRRPSAEQLREKLIATGHKARIDNPEELCRTSDVIITVTPSREPIVMSQWIRPGSHICAMGADTRGKQELEASLVARAELFGDVPQQAIFLGEAQHAFGQGLVQADDIITLGRVINKSHPGRSSTDAITIFDSTGMALQDIAASVVALEAATGSGQAIVIE
jgi:alanine dehydrogenase